MKNWTRLWSWFSTIIFRAGQIRYCIPLPFSHSVFLYPSLCLFLSLSLSFLSCSILLRYLSLSLCLFVSHPSLPLSLSLHPPVSLPPPPPPPVRRPVLVFLRHTRPLVADGSTSRGDAGRRGRTGVNACVSACVCEYEHLCVYVCGTIREAD